MPAKTAIGSAHRASWNQPDVLSAEISRLYLSERDRLLRIAALLVGDRSTAEDVVHDAFVALQRHLSSLDDPAAAAGYLSVSVANGARSVLRRRRVAFRHLRVGEPEAAAGADTAALLADEHRAVLAAVRKLPRRQQEVVILRYWADLSETQIAQAMGIAPGTVKSSAARGLANVHKYLEGQT